MIKKTAVGAVALCLAPMLSLAAAGITGSAHDFTAKSWNTRQGLCSTCHSMHKTDTTQLVPLWSHKTTASVFVPYSSATLNASVGQPGNASLACLSCHDGTVAINDYGGSLHGTAEYVEDAASFGIDLRGFHPISFTYDTALATADGYLNNPATYLVTGTGFSGTKTIAQEMLRNGKLECVSCHDIHRQRGNSMNSGIYTVKSGSYGGLCLTCHIK